MTGDILDEMLTIVNQQLKESSSMTQKRSRILGINDVSSLVKLHCLSRSDLLEVATLHAKFRRRVYLFLSSLFGIIGRSVRPSPHSLVFHIPSSISTYGTFLLHFFLSSLARD